MPGPPKACPVPCRDMEVSAPTDTRFLHHFPLLPKMSSSVCGLGKQRLLLQAHDNYHVDKLQKSLTSTFYQCIKNIDFCDVARTS